jgi:hypothetical protein
VDIVPWLFVEVGLEDIRETCYWTITYRCPGYRNGERARRESMVNKRKKARRRASVIGSPKGASTGVVTLVRNTADGALPSLSMITETRLLGN